MSYRYETDWYVVCDWCKKEMGPYQSEGEDPPDITIPGWTEWEDYHFCNVCHGAYVGIKNLKWET